MRLIVLEKFYQKAKRRNNSKAKFLESPIMNGILLVNKPKGITSHDVVAKVRKVFKMKAVGHAGTLDPMADGLLIILLGEATKFSDYIMGQDKHYVAEIQVGLTTDSWDAEGQVLSNSAHEINEDDKYNESYRYNETDKYTETYKHLETDKHNESAEVFISKNKIDFSEEEIKKQVQNLVGLLSLEVPIYSAIKINGKKLYDYARQGQQIEAPIRNMNFYSADLLERQFQVYQQDQKSYKTLKLIVDLKCEKGSYIRSWVHQLGKNLGSGAIMSALTRHQSGSYSLENALEYSKLNDAHIKIQEESKNKTESSNSEALLENIKTYVQDLKNIMDGPFFRIHHGELKLLKNGQIPKDLNLRIRPLVKQCQIKDESQLVRIFDSRLDHLIAVIKLSPNAQPKILRYFQN